MSRHSCRILWLDQQDLLDTAKPADGIAVGVYLYRLCNFFEFRHAFSSRYACRAEQRKQVTYAKALAMLSVCSAGNYPVPPVTALRLRHKPVRKLCSFVNRIDSNRYFVHTHIHVPVFCFRRQDDALRQRTALETLLADKRKTAEAARANLSPLSMEAASDAATRANAADQAERAALERELKSKLAHIENDRKAFEICVEKIVASTQGAVGKSSERSREEAAAEWAAAAAQVKKIIGV